MSRSTPGPVAGTSGGPDGAGRWLVAWLAKRRSSPFVASACVHGLLLFVLAFIVFRLPAEIESISVDAHLDSESSIVEFDADSGLIEIVASDSAGPALVSTELHLVSHSSQDLSFDPAGSLSSGAGEGQGEPGLPDSLAKLVAARGGRVLKGKQQGISATLQWKGPDDLDLHLDCGSEHCCFYNMKTHSVELDVDANADSGNLIDNPIENVISRTKVAPKTRIRVSVNHYGSRSRGASRPFTLFVVVDGVCETFTGEVAPGETKLVWAFERGKPVVSSPRDQADAAWLAVKGALKSKQLPAAQSLALELVKNYPQTEAAKKARDWLKTRGVAIP
jgi:hypothetical protein